MRRPGALLLAACVAAGTGCAASSYTDAAEALQTRNPHAALEYVGLALQADRNYDRAHDLASVKILILIAREHEAKVQAMAAAGNFEEAVADCDRVVASAALVRTLPGAEYQIYHEDHRAELAGKAAEKFYQLGHKHRAEGNPREAALAFRRALGFRREYKDARALCDEAVQAAKVRMFVRAETRGDDPDATRAVADGIPRAARERGLQFLEFVTDAERASAFCVVRTETATFHDTDWQAEHGSNEVWVTRRDPNTGQTLVDPATGKALQEKKTGQWTRFTRKVTYQARYAFQVDARGGGQAPTGSAGRALEDAAVYATWHGAQEAVPDEIRSLPSTPRQLKGRQAMATEAAAAAIDELAHQLFLAYEK